MSGLGRFFRSILMTLGFVTVQVLVIGSPAETQELKRNRQTEWEKTIKAAEEEGKVNLYVPSGAFDLIYRDLFQKKFPKIKVTTVPGKTTDLGKRITSERRSGVYIPDLFIGGGTTLFEVMYSNRFLDPIVPLLDLPDVLDRSKWFQGKHHYLDPEKKLIFVFEGSANGGAVIYNTKLVNPPELKSFWDLLEPKWKGKIVVMDPTSRGPVSSTQRFFYYNPDLGPEFLRKLFRDMNVTIAHDDVQLINWVAVGRFAIGFYPRGIEIAIEQGLPIKEFEAAHFKEGASLVAPNGNVVLLNRAPNPNAAKVAVNWLLSREGQIAWLETARQKTKEENNSMREDIPTELVNPNVRRVKGVKYLDVATNPDLMNMTPIYELTRKALDDSKKQ